MANLGTDIGHLVALLLGTLCVLLGFFLVARGVGTTESESSLRIAGVEFKLSKVGPGILFALIGVTFVWLGMQPGGAARADEPKPAVNNTVEPVANATDDPVDEPDGPANTQAPQPVKTIPAPAPPPDTRLEEQHEREAGALRAGLTAMASGACPTDLLAPSVQQACQQQLWWAPANLQQRGPIQSIDYESPYQPGSSVSIYRVRFYNSEMRWAVSLGGDGRLVTMASPG